MVMRTIFEAIDSSQKFNSFLQEQAISTRCNWSRIVIDRIIAFNQPKHIPLILLVVHRLMTLFNTGKICVLRQVCSLTYKNLLALFMLSENKRFV